MPGIALTPKQEQTKKIIVELLGKLLQWEQRSKDEVNSLLDQLAEEAHQLHMELKEEGQEPKHSAMVLANRSQIKPTEKEFYRHMHAAESLLIFLEEGGGK